MSIEIELEKNKGLVISILNRFKKYVFDYKTFVDWDEMEQVAMIALYKAIENYDKTKGTFKNYAITAIDRALRRQLTFDSKGQDNLEIDSAFNIADDVIDNDNNINREIIVNRIKSIISRLPITSKSRDILLSRLDGLTFKEIGSKFNTTASNAQNIIYRHKDKILNEYNRRYADVD